MRRDSRNGPGETIHQERFRAGPRKGRPFPDWSYENASSGLARRGGEHIQHVPYVLAPLGREAFGHPPDCVSRPLRLVLEMDEESGHLAAEPVVVLVQRDSGELLFLGERKPICRCPEPGGVNGK